MEGAPIVPHSLETKGNKKNFKMGQLKKKFFMNPLHLLKIVFFKIQSINSHGDGFMCQYGGKMSKFTYLD